MKSLFHKLTKRQVHICAFCVLGLEIAFVIGFFLHQDLLGGGAIAAYLIREGLHKLAEVAVG